MPPFILRVHPNDVASGIALIAAAGGAVRQGQGAVLAAWAHCHTMIPYAASECGAIAMLQAAAQTFAGACGCFRFKAGLSRKAPGLVAAPSLRQSGPAYHRFDSAFKALSATIRQGGFGLVVSNGVHNPEHTYAPVFHPGILVIHPCFPGEPRAGYFGNLAWQGFPTLMITEADSCPLSAHERLELCAALAGRMAEDVRALRPTPVDGPISLL